METQISVNVQDGTTQEDVDEILCEIREISPESTIRMEEPKGAFPPFGDPVSIIIGINASVQLIAFLYPRIKRKFSEIGGDTMVVDTDEVAKEYLDQHTRVEREQLDLQNREVSGDYVVYYFEYTEDGSEHYIKVNRESPMDWKYEQI